MTEVRDTNRAMFWRILRRLLGANRGRLFVMLLALGAGAAVTSALLNLQVDAKRRLTTEFRAFGANGIVAPQSNEGSVQTSNTISQSVLQVVQESPHRTDFFGIPFLFLVANISSHDSTSRTPAVVAGTNFDKLALAEPGATVSSDGLTFSSEADCMVGANLSVKLHLQPGSIAHMENADRTETCTVKGVLFSGGEGDDQIFITLGKAQQLAKLPGRLSVVQVFINGTPSQIQGRIASLAKELPGVEVRPIRQFTEGEAKIYNRISGLLTATIGIVLLLTALCVMAAMTNVAIERKMDVGLMKAIGGATQRVVRLFLAEAALLGLAGGLIGAVLGILLSIGLGKAVFGVAARPRLIVYPVAVGLTVLVAVVSAFPLRRLAGIRPASVFRGEA